MISSDEAGLRLVIVRLIGRVSPLTQSPSPFSSVGAPHHRFRTPLSQRAPSGGHPVGAGPPTDPLRSYPERRCQEEKLGSDAASGNLMDVKWQVISDWSRFFLWASVITVFSFLCWYLINRKTTGLKTVKANATLCSTTRSCYWLLKTLGVCKWGVGTSDRLRRSVCGCLCFGALCSGWGVGGMCGP